MPTLFRLLGDTLRSMIILDEASLAADLMQIWKQLAHTHTHISGWILGFVHSGFGFEKAWLIHLSQALF